MNLIDVSTIERSNLKKKLQFWHMQYKVCVKRNIKNNNEHNLDNEFVAFNNWKMLENTKFYIEGIRSIKTFGCL